VYAQDEPINQGGFSYIQPHINKLLQKMGDKREMAYVGRAACAASSTGIMDEHI